MQDLASLTRPSEWVKVRREIDAEILKVLGQFPKERGELQMKVVDELSFPGFTRQRVNYFVDEWERISAWLFLPDGKEENPAILCLHDMVPQGKDEPAGVEGDGLLAFARRYADLGFVTLAPDTITAGERISTGLPPYNTKMFSKDYPKLSVMGKLLWDNLHAVDLLSDMRFVDPSRIGVIGQGLGGASALFLAAFDERIQTCVASSAFMRFADDPYPARWVEPEGFVQMTKLKPCIASGEYPFDWEHVLAMGAPIPTMVVASQNEEGAGNAASCAAAVEQARSVYRILGAADAITSYTAASGSRITADALDASDEWFQRWL